MCLGAQAEAEAAGGFRKITRDALPLMLVCPKAEVASSPTPKSNPETRTPKPEPLIRHP
jgi:hypothetical protein